MALSGKPESSSRGRFGRTELSCIPPALEPETNPRSRSFIVFSNAPISTPDGLCWDIDAIFEGLIEGIAVLCSLRLRGPSHPFAVDGWAVDYVRFEQQGRSPFRFLFVIETRETEKAELQVHLCSGLLHVLYSFDGGFKSFD